MSSDYPLRDRCMLVESQLARFRKMLVPVIRNNAFYGRKLASAGLSDPGDIRTLEDYRLLPVTTKDEFSADQDGCPPYGTNLTFSLADYVRVHQTSGTTGMPLRWLDTPESWGLVRRLLARGVWRRRCDAGGPPVLRLLFRTVYRVLDGP